MSVQRGDLVAGRYRLGDPLGPAWRAHDEHDDVEVVLVPAAEPDTAPWRDRPAVLPPVATATGDHGAWLTAAPVAARTLAEAVAQWGALPSEQVLTIAAGAAAALSGPGPDPGMTADHILLTDEGKVLLLPLPASQDALFELGAALFLAAEGRSPFEPASGEPRQPGLAALIRGLMQKDPDRAAALDRAYEELSRLGAPVAARAGDGAAGDVAAGAESTQAMSVAELLAETGAEAALDDAADRPGEPDEPDEPTQAMSTAELLARTDENAALGDGEPEADEPTQAMSTAELLADTDDELAALPAGDAADEEPTRAAPVVAEADDEPTQAVPVAAEADDEPTQAVPSAAAGMAAAASGSGSDDEPTQAVPSIAPSPDDAPTHAVPLVAASAGLPDDEATRQVPAVAPAAVPEDPPTKPEPIPEVTAAVAPPTQVAYIAPPTQAAMPVPPPQQQQPQAPQPQQPPQYSAAPPTQAAAAFSPPPPGQNPWLQPPPQPQNQPPNAWQQQAGPPPGPPGGWGPQGQPLYPMQGPPPKNNTGKTVGIIVGVVAAVAAVVLVAVLVSNGGGKSDNVNTAAHTSGQSSQPSSVPGTNFASGSSTSSTSSSPSPSDSSSDTTSPSDTDTPSTSDSSSSDSYTPPPDLTSTPFDPSVLNEGATDKTPLTLEALAPQDFRDDRGVHYSLKAGSIQPCVQSDMSANMKDILTSNSCTKEVAASYVDDSGQYLVSVKVLPLPDQHTATVIYNDLAKENAADFGIWCPQDGPGSAACQGDYRSATIKQYREQQHRYVVLSVALAVNHSEESSIAPWLDAAAKKAVDAAGPDNWSGNQ